ncbi:MAG: sigma-54-dependent Fis family transcriptional regulator [Desulfobacteraceae bacterium]|nr:sigma-54-dependent Fis family transcriptional regulator [Desulfobacteraceae bacterium]
MFPSLLVVDDEPFILQSLSGILSDEGFEVSTASNGYEALKFIEEESPDLVLLDIWMPGLDGIETLKEIKKNNPHIQVIIITGHGTIETAVKAIKVGAFDLIEKPLSIDKVIVAINNALNFRRLEEENRYLRRKTLEKHSLTGNSPAILELKKQIHTAAPSDKCIFISGENGTGKELVARTIHQLSPRANHPMVDINCAAISEDLFDSELFGHEKGALTKASTKKTGKFELADKGTLFFDEISDMSMKIQNKLLRVLQELKFERLGGSRAIDVKARIIASTSKNVQEEIQKGLLRENLYFRLNVIPIHVPPLRERVEDIPLLIDSFLRDPEKFSARKIKTFTPEAVQILSKYPWPGNVRELKNFIERLTIMIDEKSINEKHVLGLLNSGPKSRTEAQSGDFYSINNLKEASLKFEKEFIELKMKQYHNDIDKTADTLGIKPDALRKKIKP